MDPVVLSRTFRNQKKKKKKERKIHEHS